MPATAPPTAKNQPVPGYPTFIPANPQPIASLIKDTKAYPQNGGKIPRVYQELELRGTVFKNRLFAVCCFVRSRDNMTHSSFCLGSDVPVYAGLPLSSSYILG